MIIVSISSTQKDFNGMPYTEFQLALNDSGVNRIVRVTGKTPVCAVMPDGSRQTLDRLDKTQIAKGDNVVFWFDLKDRICQIDLILPSDGSSEDEYIF